MKKAALAEADKLAAPDRDWWRREALWRNASGGRAEPAADEAFASIRAQCRITPLQAFAEARQNLDTYWRGVDWKHLRAKARESAFDAEVLDRQHEKGEPLTVAYRCVALRFRPQPVAQMRLPL
jgi:hypothetical protein